MYVHSGFSRRGQGPFLAALIAGLTFFLLSVEPSLAQTTGTLAGTVTAGDTKAPLANVVVTAVSPTGTFRAVTDKKGFYAFAGVLPDTYTVSFELPGYEPVSLTGVTVFAELSISESVVMHKALRTIGRVQARGITGAFQPDQTQDTYSIGTDQIETINGRDFNTNEANLIASLPGASFDSSGYPVLRGGRENEEGFQFEGVNIVDPYSNQFNNSLSVNGIGSFQLIPGAGNATIGNAGTGTINYTAKRGTYPPTGTFDVEAQTGVFDHQLSIEYGISSPSGNISNYVSFIGQRSGVQYGPYGLQAVDLGTGIFNGGERDFEENNFVDNFVFKFGRNNDTELQLLYQNQVDRFGFNYGGYLGQLHYELGDPYYTGVGAGDATLFEIFGFTPTEIASALAPLPYQGSLTGLLPQSAQYQPNALFKAQISHSFDSSTYLRTSFYRDDAVTTFNLPDPNVFGAYELQGGLTTGFTADFTKQLSSKNLFQTGGKFEFGSPEFNIESNDDSALATGVGGLFGLTPFVLPFADFLPPTDANCVAIMQSISPPTSSNPTGGTCGYLYKYFPNGVNVPLYDRSSQIARGSYAFYVNDKYSPSDRLHIEGGLRLDGANVLFPDQFAGINYTIPDDARHPLIPEPRLAATWQLSRDDAVRASYGRSVQLPPLGDYGRTIDPAVFQKFDNIPSYNNFTNGPATYCGPNFNQTCTSYGQQLFDLYQFGLGGTAIQPVVPETFTNWDFSYSHQFPNAIALKVTPFYTRGFDIVDRVATVLGFNPSTGAAILNPVTSTNLGSERTTGLELYVTRENPIGFSGSFSATYINKFSNVPPLVADEDFFPTIPTASLLLGNQYRVGYLSPFQATAAMQYKSRGGLRVNPQIMYVRGYPQNPGTITALFINGKPYNVPLTNASGPLAGAGGWSNFVDPVNPGTYFNPNIDAGLGTPEAPSPGGVLSHAQFTTNLTVEFSPPHSRSTVGVQIFNLFDQLYGRPGLNYNLQPIAYGVLGPQTGKLYNYQQPGAYGPVTVPYLGAIPNSQYGEDPYTIYQTNQPFTALLYYQFKI